MTASGTMGATASSLSPCMRYGIRVRGGQDSRPYMYRVKTKSIKSLCLLGLVVASTHAQQTVFNVPSADVLIRGKAYLEWDAAISESVPLAALTPRMAWAMGWKRA
jgi:hypothetical protein